MKSEQIKEITDKATEHLVAALHAGHSEALTDYLKAIGRFHRYSLHNVMLIASQKPNASYVAGFRAWNQLGRFVKKGEKGIVILAPIVRRKAENDEDHQEASASVAGFRAAYVFDVSQTDGQELAAHRNRARPSRANIANVSASSRRLREFPSNTHPRSLPRVEYQAAAASRCFPASRRRKSSQPLRTNWPMNSCTGVIAAAPHRAEPARLKRRPPRSWCATPSGSKPVRPLPTTSSCGMEMRSSSRRAWAMYGRRPRKCSPHSRVGE